jgi:chromosome segregation ATPase
MLVLEGFGNIVAAPNHEKIACLLADRTKLLSELNYLKNEKLSATAAVESSPSHLSPLTPPVSTNEKITSEKLRLLNEKIELLDNENMSLKDLNIRLKNQIDDSTKSIKNYENQIKDLLNSSNNNENNKIKTKTNGKDSDEEDIIEASKLEINKLKQDNLNLKMEIDKLYDEIGHLEIETKQLRDENKKLFTELNELTEMEKSEMSKDAMEIKKLKKEIDDLNNELDDLVQYKANYELAKKENEKLSSQIKELEVITSEKQEEKSSFLKSSISQPNIAALVAPLSPLAKLKNSGMSNDKLSSPNKQQSSSQLELDWIRRENENLLIDLEKTQTKLNEKIAQYNELKNQMAVKDEQMKIFISKYEKQQTTKDDLLNLQMKILDLEEALNNEKEKHLKELDANETNKNDLLKRNDHLWSQLTNLEQSYNDALELIQIQTKENENILSKIKEYERQLSELNDEKQSSLMIIEKMRGKNDKLELEIDNLNQVVNKLNLDLEALTQTNDKNEERNKKEVNGLNKKISELEREIEIFKKMNFDFKFEVDALMKEKSFIINQNDSTQQKVLQDYLSLQEKHADTKMELNKLKNEHSVIELSIKEKDLLIKGLELDNNQLSLSLKSEINEKKEALEKIKTLDKTNLQVYFFKHFLHNLNN